MFFHGVIFYTKLGERYNDFLSEICDNNTAFEEASINASKSGKEKANETNKILGCGIVYDNLCRQRGRVRMDQ